MNKELQKTNDFIVAMCDKINKFANESYWDSEEHQKGCEDADFYVKMGKENY